MPRTDSDTAAPIGLRPNKNRWHKGSFRATTVESLKEIASVFDQDSYQMFRLGNIGFTIIKRSYLVGENIFLGIIFVLILAHLNTRSALKSDFYALHIVLACTLMSIFVNIVVLVTLAFYNDQYRSKRKESHSVYRSIILLVLNLISMILRTFLG